jgi:hypothetical protein
MLSGCGYSLAGRAGPLQGRTIDVGMFANRTYQPDIEAVMRLALVNELAAGGRKVETGVAELAISGDIVLLVNEASAYSATDTVMLYRLKITVMAELLDRKSGRHLWKVTETLQQDYPATADLALQANARTAAIESICHNMAKVLVARMNYSF